MEDKVMPTLRNCTVFAELRRIHAHILVSSLSESSYLATQMINICNANGRIEYAALVFNQVKDPNVFLYNAMIKAYTQSHHCNEAIGVYMQMLRSQRQDPIFADRFTYPFVVKACGGLLALDLGKQIHSHIIKSGFDSNSIVQNSLIEMYTRCDDLALARNLFDEMSQRDVVSWNTLISAHARLGQMRKARALFNSMPNKTVVSWTALISGYSSIGCYSDAVQIFHQMQLEGFDPDDISVVSVLPACAQLGALELGKWIHAYCDKHALLNKTFICNALMEMYARCGSIDQASQLFDDMVTRDVISWSTMISALALHGGAREAIQLFVQMENDRRVRPNAITFLGLLSACSHAGLLDEGLNYFDSMKGFYGIDPGIEHYGCLVDLLGRSGCIAHAVEIIDGMPMPPDATIWGSLLSACRTHGDIETATKAVERLVELEPDDTGNYVILSNMYAAAGRWDSVASMRRVMRSKSMKKTPGCSLIEVNNVVQEFVAGDDSNPQFGEISCMLDLLAYHLDIDGLQRSIVAEGNKSCMDSDHELNNDIYFA
ncbi:pentatricopeptide repeat-containing protein At2g20540 [Typha angustifolia]|uniref:pentatricopeptide repeat-containing protein At2g20540 n=1 Tax=Typha angustifolia TaxID=59011 RepID=UPI003C2B72D3